MAGIIGYYDPDGILAPNSIEIMVSAQFNDESYSHKSIKRDRGAIGIVENRICRSTVCGTEILRSKLNTYHPFLVNDFIDEVNKIFHKWRRKHKFYAFSFKAPFTSSCKYNLAQNNIASIFSLLVNMAIFSSSSGVVKYCYKFHIDSKLFSKTPSPFSL